MHKMIVAFAILILGTSYKAASQLDSVIKADRVLYNKKLTIVPQNFYNSHLPFFCKTESELQKHTNINLFVRLGNKDYVDYLEKKPNARKNY